MPSSYFVTAFIVVLSFSQAVMASQLSTHLLDVGWGRELRVGIQRPENSNEIKADILYLHGFGDRLDNHGPLFEEWVEAGFRVISFDFPSHGETKAWSLDLYGFMDLASFALDVEASTREDVSRPLFLAGWSTGGLLAVRMLQTEVYENMTRKPTGLILFAPGVSVYKFVGGDGVIRESTLTNNPSPPHKGPVKPISPFLKPKFAAALLMNAFLARSQTLPSNLSVLTFVAGQDADLYAKANNVEKWAIKQRQEGANLFGFKCPGSKHEMDNEPYPIGHSVRFVSSKFAEYVLKDEQEKIYSLHNETCQSF